MLRLMHSIVRPLVLLASLLVTSTQAQTSTLSDLDSLRYIASHGDLIEAFGADPAKGRSHYEQWGIKEGRKITFEPSRYMASHADLIDAFKGDELKATIHYIQYGYKERRQTTFSDLDALQYIASYGDLIQAFGSNVLSGIRHYVSFGYQEGRRAVFDALAYIASYGDLISAFGTDAVAGAKHYIDWGYKEGRQVVFDALGYLSRYTDLQQAFGSDTVAVTRHYIDWGLKEGRTYALTVSVKVTGPGTASKNRIFLNPGERASVILAPAGGGYLASVSGCGGSLRGEVFTTNPVNASCEINAAFRSAVGEIEGRVTAFDAARPAFVSVVSGADDSVLVTRQIDGSGAFKFTGLDDRKDYYLEFEQPGYSPSAVTIDYGPNRRVKKSGSSFVESLLNMAGIQSSDSVTPATVLAQVGDRVTFETKKIQGLSDGFFTYSWEGNPTVSGAEFSSYVVDPLKVEVIGKAEIPSDNQAALQLANEYGLYLVNPGSPSAMEGALTWTSEHSDRLLRLVAALNFPRQYVGFGSSESQKELPPTYVTLSSKTLPEDLSKEGTAYLQGKFSISEAAFVNATPSLVRVEGKRGTFFSNRLFKALVRVVTNGGTDISQLARIIKDRYGITVSSDPNHPMPLPYQPSTCPEFLSDCQQAEWRTFKPDEMLDIASILEEYPEPLKNLSAPSEQRGLRYFLRRRDGVFHPRPDYKPFDAIAWIDASYAEFMEKGFGGIQIEDLQARERTRAQRYNLIVHEKAHFIWANQIDDQTRMDWAKLSGWWVSPLKPGEDPKISGNCSAWENNPSTWEPPNTTAANLRGEPSFGHEKEKIIADDFKGDELKGMWGSCSTAQFVSAYAAKNPFEDFSDSFAAFMVNPDLLRTRALPKYEFLRDRLMQGVLYISRIREDLTFQVFNLYPDYIYPGKIKSLEVTLTGKPEQDKTGKVRITLHSSTCKASQNSACFEGAEDASSSILSRVLPEGNRQDMPIGFRPIDSQGLVLEGTFGLSKYAAAGWWHAPQITVRDQVGNERQQKATSGDYGWKLYVDSPLEDVTAPVYIKNSVRIELLEPGDSRISSGLKNAKGLSGDERELVVSWRVTEKNRVTACQSGTVSDSGRPSQGLYPGESRPLTNQADGANWECDARLLVTRYFPSDLYSVPALYTNDIARNGGEVRLSPQGKDPTIERSPELRITSPNSDIVAPVLDISPCKSSDLDERCLRILAKPTNPASPDGETVVDLYYWAYEEGPLERASGLGRVEFSLRDPVGKVFSYPAQCRDWWGGNAFGVPGECSIEAWQYANIYFVCPDGTPSKPERTVSKREGCTAITPVRYHAQVILPRGSAPGTWGLYEMTLEDKVRNSRSYNFTENFRFVPSGSSGTKNTKSVQSSNSTNFTFEVGGKSDSTETALKTSGVLDVYDAGQSGFVGWFGEWTSAISSRLSAMSRWFAQRREMGIPIISNLVQRRDFAMNFGRSSLSDVADPTTGREAEMRPVSASEDQLTGSVYKLSRAASTKDGMQSWQLDYRGRNDVLFSTKSLPETAEVSWRRFGLISEQLATTGWTRVCSDRVWTVQDGYQLLFHVGDRALADLRPGQLFVNSTAEATVLTDVRCAFGGAVWIEGYAFGVSDNEPPLRASSVPATRFAFALDRYGALTKREVNSAPFDLVGLCSAPANENKMFCSEAKKTVGW